LPLNIGRHFIALEGPRATQILIGMGLMRTPLKRRQANSKRILENEAKVQDEAVAAAQRSLDLSVTRYKGGVTSYLEVTIAQSAALSDQVTAVNILGRRMANTVLLIQALGGGWD
jgi:outer membrane protein TolC